MFLTRSGKYALAALIALVTFLVYLPALYHEFTWDDGWYVLNNPFIRSFDTALIKWAFFDFYAANWHPLTWISHALDYALWGLNPSGHHLTNILLHAINTAVVVLLVMKLLEVFNENAPREGRSSLQPERTMLIAAGTTGLLFGLHPIHVESVAWVAERKDLLCALFFLLSIIAYVRYSRDQGPGDRGQGAEGRGSTPCARRFAFSLNRQYLLSLVLFILALMSKPMAVTLPLVLLILDWHPFNRIRSLKTLRAACVEKIPFIALSIGSSYLTILAQDVGGALRSAEFMSWSTRVLVAAQALIVYLWKMLWPLHLVPFYPYPATASPASAEYLVPVVLVIGFTLSSVIMIRKQFLWSSVWGYYVVTLIPVLGIVQVGDQSMADRYTYLPSLGPFLVAGLGAAWIVEKATRLKPRGVTSALIVSAPATVICVLLSSLTVVQTGIWKNNLVLWTFVIEKEPDTSPFVYYNRGNARLRSGQPELAIADFDIAVSLKHDYYEAFGNRGIAYEKRGQLDRAIMDYDTALALNQNDAITLRNRGFAYLKIGQAGRGMSDFQKACGLGDAFACQALQSFVKNGR